MTQADKARAFTALHVPGKPLVLYNIWDAGSAHVVAKAGAKAIATGSWSVAGAQGYPDGEQIPMGFLLQIATRIAETTDLPLTVDFEGGYTTDPDALKANIRALIATGAVGLNFEDQIVGGEGLHPVDAQAARIRAIRSAAEDAEMPLFINARTDIFLKAKDGHAALIDDALARATSYAQAGASGFFVPGLSDPALIAKITAATDLPVNVMIRSVTVDQAASANAARASFGPGPFVQAMATLGETAQT